MSQTALRVIGSALVLLSAFAAAANQPNHQVTGTHSKYHPLLTYEPGGALIQASLRLGGRVEMVDAIPVGIDGAVLDSEMVGNVLARIGLKFDSRLSMAPVGFGLDFELDAYSGVVTDAPTLEGAGLPNTEGTESVIRRAMLRFSIGRYLHLLGGLTVSDFGMGLIANSGDRGWTPGSAVFNDPRRGDRVLRLMVATGPLTPERVTFGVGYDFVQDDDILLKGDEAQQIVGAVRFGVGGPHSGGVYVAYRNQETAEGKTLKVMAVDVTGSTTMELSKTMSLKLETELAFISGDTTLGPSTDFPRHKVTQIGAAVRASLDASVAGAVLDFLYASGDQNLDDKSQNGFRTDRNYQLGFMTWRYLMAAHSGRATHTAADPELSGRPAEDLDRFPTRQSATNTISIFPRGWWRPVDGLEIYGGPLFAWSEVPLVDPLQTRLNGGSPRNAFGGKPGSYLATEVDLGIRYRTLFHGTELTLGLEGGIVIPGSAFEDSEGNSVDPIYGGRFMLEYRL
ncbi:MAG: hypothetical protein ACI9WU_002845 [Myxococcota bacterium]|jgi:hypothetical protein